MKYLFVLFSIILSFNIFAHGDHTIPGAIPPAPHGGSLGEAEHAHKESHNHDHVKASKKEIFFEGKLKNSKLTVYPLELEPTKSKVFLILKTQSFTKVDIKVMDPRKKIVIATNFESMSNQWSINLKGSRGRRFIIHISAIYEGASYKTKFQVEKK